jgi:hypothetical protein
LIGIVWKKKLSEARSVESMVLWASESVAHKRKKWRNRFA